MNRNLPSLEIGSIIRFLVALVLTAGLLLFLVATRLARMDDTPTLGLRTLETTDPVSPPAPEPPPPDNEEPPEPPDPELPRLDLRVDPLAPPVKANPREELELELQASEFAPQTEAPRRRMTFASRDLDTQPRLVNRPSVQFPESLKARGVDEGRVTLEVLIDSAGRVTVRRVLESSHAELTEMARSFAGRSHFTPPKKDGRAVNALFKWPLILRP